MGIRLRQAVIAVTAAVLFGALVPTGVAAAAPPSPTPAPAPPGSSSTDEITDMVMDAIERQASPNPPLPAPPTP